MRMGINMDLGCNFRIESDGLNVTVSKRSVTKGGDNQGKETWANEAYVSTLPNALKWLVDQEVKDTGLTDLKTIIAKQNELYALIEKVAK
jgi:hypothetical protein